MKFVSHLLVIALGASLSLGASAQQPQPVGPYKDFKGTINLDVRDSKADWGPFTPKKAPAGAPNILFVLYDDTGLAAWSPYGGRINMPTLDKLAQNGITYTQWHTVALCSPTRSTLLTGRNHTLNGMAAITEGSNGFPGWAGRIPPQAATIAQVLQDNGYSTFWLGKNHNVPEQDVAEGGDRKTWPLGQGFERYYGFIGGETNQWYPDLVEDNHFIEPPASPEQGYHLSKDLADQAIKMIRNQQAASPSKPWFMFYNPGANHAPHQAPKEYIAKYKGKFDDGYEAYRTWVLARMIEKGIVPKDTRLTPINPLPESQANPADAVRPWDTLNADEKKLFSHMAEVWAGLSEYTDVQIGRVIDYLEKTGQLENTMVLYAADNGTLWRGHAERFCQREQVLQRLSRRSGREHEAVRQARGTRHLRPFPHRLGCRILDTVSDVQALRAVLRRHGRSARHLLAEGHQGARRDSRPVPPFGGHRADDPRRRRPRDAQGLPRRGAVPALRCINEVHLRCGTSCAHAEEAAVLLHARHPWDVGGRLARCGGPRPVHRQRPFRSGPMAALSRR